MRIGLNRLFHLLPYLVFQEDRDLLGPCRAREGGSGAVRIRCGPSVCALTEAGREFRGEFDRTSGALRDRRQRVLKVVG